MNYSLLFLDLMLLIGDFNFAESCCTIVNELKDGRCFTVPFFDPGAVPLLVHIGDMMLALVFVGLSFALLMMASMSKPGAVLFIMFCCTTDLLFWSLNADCWEELLYSSQISILCSDLS